MLTTDRGLSVELAGRMVQLLPERGVFVPDDGTLYVADVHWGKAAAFRAAAIPVPAGSTASDLERLSGLIERTGARRLVILGDLLHARTARQAGVLAAVTEWRARWVKLPVLLVRGNHDRQAGDPPRGWGMDVVDEPYAEGGFVLRHTPAPSEAGPVLCGHLHPAVRLAGRGRQGLRLPCFHWTGKVLTLPAFGSFTGTAVIRPERGDRLYVIAEGEVIGVGSCA